MSEYGFEKYGRRKYSSEESSSEESSEGEYHRGPKKIYQKGHSRRHHRREHGHYSSRKSSGHRDHREYGSRRRHHRSRRNHYGAYGERHGQDGYHSLGHHRSRRSMQSHANPSFMHSPPPPRYPEKQYFPQPAKLMSMVESQLNNIDETKPRNEPSASYKMEPVQPIRVNRQIYEHYSIGDEKIVASADTSNYNKKTLPDKESDHLYESLDETKSNYKNPSQRRYDDKSGNESEMLYGFAL